MMKYGSQSFNSYQSQPRKNLMVFNEVPIDEVINSPLHSRPLSQSFNKKFTAKPKQNDSQQNSLEKFQNRFSQSSCSIGEEEYSQSGSTTGYATLSQQSHSQLNSLSFSQTDQSSLNKYSLPGIKTDNFLRRQVKSYSLPYASTKESHTNWNHDSKEIKELSQNMSLQNSLQEQKKLLQDIAYRTRESVSELKGVSTLMSSLDSGKISSKESYILLTEEIRQMRESMNNRDNSLEKLMKQTIEQNTQDLDDHKMKSLENVFSKQIEIWVTKLQNHMDGKIDSILKSISTIHHDSFDTIPFDAMSNISYQSTHCADLDLFEQSKSSLIESNDLDIFMSDLDHHSFTNEKDNQEILFNKDNMLESKTPTESFESNQGMSQKDRKIYYPLEWADDPNNLIMNSGIMTRSKRAKHGIEIPTPPDGFGVIAKSD